jgi:hypothetical protein
MFTALLPVFPLLIDALTNHVIILHICREWCGFSAFFGFSVFRHSISVPRHPGFAQQHPGSSVSETN